MPLTFLRADITTLSCDVVVNAANTKLLPGGGVCGAIFKAAGFLPLALACRKIGSCAVGDAVMTKGFKLKAKAIIHTVGPVYGKDPANQDRLLGDCYRNSLRLAAENGFESIAFPLISSGIYGYPKDKALNIATNAIKDFLQESETDMQVFLVVYDKASFEISRTLYEDIRSYIDEREVRPPAASRMPEDGAANMPFGAPAPDAFPVDAAPAPDDFPVAAPAPDDFPGSTGKHDYTAKENPPHDEISHPQAKSFPRTKPLSDRQKDFPPEAVCKQASMSLLDALRDRSLADLLDRKSETFSEMLLRLIDEKGMTDVEVYKRANIDRKLFSKIRKKDYVPKKATVFALIIGLRLNMDEARDLLSRAGFAFSESLRFDIIIEYFIEHNRYDIYEINETLFAFDEALLGN